MRFSFFSCLVCSSFLLECRQFLSVPAIIRIHFLFSDLVFRYVVPPVPVNPLSDLYPGLGAGMYPPGYAS